MSETIGQVPILFGDQLVGMFGTTPRHGTKCAMRPRRLVFRYRDLDRFFCRGRECNRADLLFLIAKILVGQKSGVASSVGTSASSNVFRRLRRRMASTETASLAPTILLLDDSTKKQQGACHIHKRGNVGHGQWLA